MIIEIPCDRAGEIDARKAESAPQSRPDRICKEGREGKAHGSGGRKQRWDQRQDQNRRWNKCDSENSGGYRCAGYGGEQSRDQLLVRYKLYFWIIINKNKEARSYDSPNTVAGAGRLATKSLLPPKRLTKSFVPRKFVLQLGRCIGDFKVLTDLAQWRRVAESI